MSNDTIIALITSSLAFFASIISIGISAYQARFARFSSEKWWERKIEAYTKIIEALSDLVYYYEQIYDSELIGHAITDEKKREIDEHWKRGFLEMKKSTNVGAFLISPQAETSLQRFWTDSDQSIDPNNWFAQLDYNYSKAQTCLKELVILAKKDLRV